MIRVYNLIHYSNNYSKASGDYQNNAVILFSSKFSKSFFILQFWRIFTKTLDLFILKTKTIFVNPDGREY